MKYDPLIEDLQLQVEEVSEKYQKLKKQLYEHQEAQANDQVQRSMEELESLVKEIQHQYAQVHEKEKLNEQSLSRIEKTIYNIIRSFNTTYTSAASNLQTH